MPSFIVTIEETISDTFEVNARDKSDAIRIAKEKYKAGEFVLEPGNLLGKRISVAGSDCENSEWLDF